MKNISTQMSFNLPESAVEFFRVGKQLDYDESQCEAGRVGLNRLDRLVLGEVWIGTDMEIDPLHDEDGYYSIPAVSLSSECQSYSPEFIILWLPQEQLFGTWDCDHWILTVFPEVSWEDIIADPLPYLNAQWYPLEGKSVPFHPWLKYEFNIGRPF
jgi:hypothetical protein